MALLIKEDSGDKSFKQPALVDSIPDNENYKNASQSNFVVFHGAVLCRFLLKT
jgi:hypothetical protein